MTNFSDNLLHSYTTYFHHKGIKIIYGTVLSDNQPMLQLCEEKNFKITRGDPGEYNLEYEVFNKEKILLESGKIIE